MRRHFITISLSPPAPVERGIACRYCREIPARPCRRDGAIEKTICIIAAFLFDNIRGNLFNMRSESMLYEKRTSEISIQRHFNPRSLV